MKLPKMAIVTWLDAHTVDGWDENIDSDPRVCTTAGYLIKETDKVVVIANSIDIKLPVTYACAMTIPKCSISKIQRLK